MRGDDRGGVATVFGVLFAGGVLLGMLALVVDVGQLYVEREELQSGADAAAIAVARSCAADMSRCTDVNRRDIATQYANKNAGKDQVANVFTVCGSAAGVRDLFPCPAAAGNLTRCIGSVPSAPKRYLEVRTTTATRNGSRLLPPSFAQTLLGKRGYDGTTVGACARVSWGAPKAGLAVAFSKCEWDAATKNGERFPAPPPYPPNALPSPADEIVLRTHDAKDQNSLCPGASGPAGWDAPGGFGWLKEDGGASCITESFTAAPTGRTEQNCTAILSPITTGAAVAKALYIPIYDRVAGTGNNAKYNIIGMAAFVPTGYFFGNPAAKRRASWLTGKRYCTGEARCIYGYFVNVLQPGPVETGPLDSLGATVISIIG
ncbi:pilus assembly protein TadG-related protein [Micromonospora sp. SL1-18]|uniref:pilus assembly protein TadG-related protein n=1 Tax=Micromonospora sp. SL1-18 TaxID=3399128 RepID=UPI003A4E5457